MPGKGCQWLEYREKAKNYCKWLDMAAMPAKPGLLIRHTVSYDVTYIDHVPY